jgi:hypothetical protein
MSACSVSKFAVTCSKTWAMRLTVELALRANRSEAWAAMSTVGGVNRELAPLVRLTDSTGGAPFDSEPWRVGAPVSWQLLLGVFPIDRHRVQMVALPEQHGYRESSSTWWYRVWWHERTLLDDPDGCVVRESVEVEPRLAVLDSIVGWAVRWTFRQRHRSLQRRFG